MAGSSLGTIFRITSWGESHGKGIGVVIDGCPASLPLDEEDLQKYLDRRKPGQNRYTTARSEADQAHILSGVFEGRTTGTPISVLVNNTDHRSADYSQIASCYRPGHADYCFDEKYGFRDYRGGGRSSGRETIARVAAGAVASKILGMLGITVSAYTSSIGPVVCSPARFDPERVSSSPLYMPDAQAEQAAAAFLEKCMQEQTSVGGTVSCIVHGLMPGIGEPVFDKLDALLGKALFSIGAVKAVEIGDGTAVSTSLGHENNDMFGSREDGSVCKLTNHAGGICGGISDGSDLLIRASFKPTPSISRTQQALGKDGKIHDLQIRGRHDPVIVPRAVVVVEAMTAITVLDLLLQNMASTMDGIKKFYSR